MKTSRLLSAAVAAASLFSFATADAAAPTGMTRQGTATLTVQVNVTGQCTVGDTTLDFGTYVSGGAAVTGSAQFSLACPVGTAYKIGLDNGGHFGTGRNMADVNGNLLAYTLTQDSAGKTAWDDTANYLSGTQIGASDTVNIYGSIPATQTVSLGAYSDSVTINVYF